MHRTTRETDAMLVLAAGALAAVCATAAASPSPDPDQAKPQPPPETAQFSFLIGDWDCTIHYLKPDGSGYAEGRARWSGHSILAGWAIQDEWTGYAADGSESHGINVRFYDTRTGKWDNRWLEAGALQWQHFEAEKVGETMVMTGGEGEDLRGKFLDRNTFYDITPDGWRWRKDRSYDGGETWFVGISQIQATRAAPPPAPDRKR